MLDLFLRAADDLVALGVDGITTSCGFLAVLHPESRRALPGAGRDLQPAADPAGAEHAAARQARRRAYCGQGGAVAGRISAPSGVRPIFRWSACRRRASFVTTTARAARGGLRAQEREVLGMARELLDEHPRRRRDRLRVHQPAALFGEDRAGHSACRCTTSSRFVEWFHAGLKPRRYNNRGLIMQTDAGSGRLLARPSSPLPAPPRRRRRAAEATFDRIRRTGVLRIAALPGEMPFFHKDLATGEWSGRCDRHGEEHRHAVQRQSWNTSNPPTPIRCWTCRRTRSTLLSR